MEEKSGEGSIQVLGIVGENEVDEGPCGFVMEMDEV